MVCCLVAYVLYRRAGFVRPGKGERRKIEKVSFLKAFFWLLPRRIVKDWLERDPDAFTHQGCIIFTGRQGHGKTIAMAHQIGQWHYEFPKSRVMTNFAFKGEHDVMNHWRKLITYKNGVYGVIAAIDETQNWFSSNQSKDFPPEMLQVITQNRKTAVLFWALLRVLTGFLSLFVSRPPRCVSVILSSVLLPLFCVSALSWILRVMLLAGLLWVGTILFILMRFARAMILIA